MAKRRKREPVPFDQQLATLAACGIALSPGVDPGVLLDAIPREQYEADPYQLLLSAMGGMTSQEQPDGALFYPSSNILYFDTECIYENGDYAAIAERMRELAQADFPLEAIADHIDIDADDVKLRFRLNGVDHEWELEADDDWVDPDLFTRFVELMDASGKARKFLYIDLGGQDCLIGCVTPEQFKQLDEKTGLKVEWLT